MLREACAGPRKQLRRRLAAERDKKWREAAAPGWLVRKRSSRKVWNGPGSWDCTVRGGIGEAAGGGQMQEIAAEETGAAGGAGPNWPSGWGGGGHGTCLVGCRCRGLREVGSAVSQEPIIARELRRELIESLVEEVRVDTRQ